MLFNAAMFSKPKHCPIDELERGILTQHWLNQLVTHFRWSDDLVKQCNVELLEFVEICGHRGMHKACGNDHEFMINWPILMLLWQTIFVIPTSIVVCKRDFLKHNWVKSKRITKLNLDTLDVLMKVSLNGFGVEFMDWNGIFKYS